MKKQVLFVFHGMGDQAPVRVNQEDDSWANGVIKTLDKAARNFDAFSDGFGDRLEIVPITYDQVFYTLVERWDRSASALKAELGAAEVSKVFGWLAGASSDEANFFWTNIVDVLLWRFSQARDQVLTRVCFKMVDKIVKELKAVGWDYDRAHFSVLAHSLGTSVAHDALQQLARAPISDEHGVDNSVLQPPNFRFKSFTALANVSRVLWTGNGRVERETLVRPHADGLPGNRYYLNGYFFNFRHVADPVPAFWRFKPSKQEWGDLYSAKKVRHFRDPNVHAFNHYLGHPKVSGLVLWSMFGSDLIPEDRLDSIVGSYQDYKAPMADLKREAVTAVEGILGSIAGEPEHPDVDDALVRIVKALLGWKDKTAALGGD
jgi:hypothetical protein